MKKLSTYLFVGLLSWTLIFLAEAKEEFAKQKNTPNINIKVSGKDLVYKNVVNEDYFLRSNSTLMQYSVSTTTSDKPIKKVEWLYDGDTWEGWTFFSYVSESKGDAITVKVTNEDDEFVTQGIEIEYNDFCNTQTGSGDFGFCLESNNFSDDGDYIPLNTPTISFYLSHSETLDGNLSDHQVLLVAESTEEAIDITAATSLSGNNLVINMLTLSAFLDLDDPTDKFYVALYGHYDNVTASFDYENTNARSKSFKLGLSGLDLLFGETANQLSVYNASAPYGKVLSSSVGTSSMSFSYLPPGEYIIHVENANKEGYAQVYVNPEELVTINFSMQPKDLSASSRQPLADSYTVSRGVFLKSIFKKKSLSRNQKIKNSLKELNQKYIKEYKRVKGSHKDDEPSAMAGIIYWNGFSVGGIDYETQYTEEMFIENAEALKSYFLSPLSSVPFKKPIKIKSKDGQVKTVTSDYPPFPSPLLSVYNMKVQGTVPRDYGTLPNKNTDFGTSGAGLPVQAGKNYAPFMFGDLPILHVSKSKEHIALKLESCLNIANGQEELEDFCYFEEEIAQETWKAFLAYFAAEYEVKIRYTVTGTYGSQDYKVEHDFVYDYGTFIDENGDLYMAASKHIYSPEFTDFNDGWLLGKQPYIYVPEHLVDPKIKVEMLTKISDDIFDDLEDYDLRVFIAGGLVEDERELPSVQNIRANSSAVDVFPGTLPLIPFKRPKALLNSEAHGKLLVSGYKMLPITEEILPNAFYYQEDHSFELILDTGPLENFEVVGVMVNAQHGEDIYPKNLSSHPKGGKVYSGSEITVNQQEVTVKVDPNDIFANDLKLDPSKDNAITLNFHLVLDDTATSEVNEEVVGPPNRTITAVPSYNLVHHETMNISSSVPIKSYSRPDAVFGKKSLASFFKAIAESSLNTVAGEQSVFRYNDASMPYGGNMSAHSTHKDGRHFDMRYPHLQNEVWDASRSEVSIDKTWCGSSRGALNINKVLHHGYKKYLAIRNYLWIKRLAIEIHNDYKLSYLDPLMAIQNPAIQDHRGELIDYIAGEDFCSSSMLDPENNPVPALKSLCDDLTSVYTVANLNEIDGLLTYIKETRSNIETMYELVRGKKINITQFLISNGAGLVSCFPTTNAVLGFDYNKNWHRLLYESGTFPDGVTAKIGAEDLEAWMNQPKVIDYLNKKEDYAHLSHIHIQAGD